VTGTERAKDAERRRQEWIDRQLAKAPAVSPAAAQVIASVLSKDRPA
jgi:hypothetical protein